MDALCRSGWKDALGTGVLMYALNMGGLRDTLCRAGWMDALSRGECMDTI